MLMRSCSTGAPRTAAAHDHFTCLHVQVQLLMKKKVATTVNDVATSAEIDTTPVTDEHN